MNGTHQHGMLVRRNPLDTTHYEDLGLDMLYSKFRQFKVSEAGKAKETAGRKSKTGLVRIKLVRNTIWTLPPFDLTSSATLENASQSTIHTHFRVAESQKQQE